MIHIYINGTDIFDRISLRYCFHEMFSEKRADRLTLKFNDKYGLWNTWLKEGINCVEAEDDSIKTGKMYVSGRESRNGIITLRALSAPGSFFSDKHSRSRRGIHLFQIGNEIALRHGLSFRQIGCSNYLYDSLMQFSESDAGFLYKLCRYEGYQILIYDGTLIIYNESFLENQMPVRNITIGTDGIFSYKDDSVNMYDSCEISGGVYHGKYSIGGSSKTYYPETELSLSDTAQANRYAKAMLREVNKNLIHGSFSKELQKDIAPGSVISVRNLKNSVWEGNYFINAISNDYINNQSIISCRKPLEGY